MGRAGVRLGWHVCTRCGYLSRSWPWTTYATREMDGVEVTEGHECPECGESYWLSVNGFGRPMREQVERDGRWDLKWRTSGADYDAWEQEKAAASREPISHRGDG
jgi:hypothetical protein